MTLNIAFSELGRKLVFGDEKQIAAVEFIAQVAACIDAIKKCEHETPGLCPECDGDGEVDCECQCGDAHTKECQKCDGDGSLDGERGCEGCLIAFSPDVQMAARDVAKRGWPKEAKAA